MQITDIKITKLKVKLKAYRKPDDFILGFVSICFDNLFMVHGIRLLEDENGIIYIEMPKHRVKDGSYKDIFHCVNSKFRLEMKKQIIIEYNSLLNDNDLIQNKNMGN